MAFKLQVHKTLKIIIDNAILGHAENKSNESELLSQSYGEQVKFGECYIHSVQNLSHSSLKIYKDKNI
jgi:hypothetical protein